MIQANSATIASRNVALPHGKNRKTTKSALAASETTAIGRQLGSPRTAECHCQWRKHPGRNDQQERDAVHPAVQGGRSSAAQHRPINPKPGQHQRHPEQGEQHDRETTCPPVRQLIADRDCEDHNQQAGDDESCDLRPPVWGYSQLSVVSR